MLTWRRPDGGWLIHTPTKRHWRDKSPIELVRASIAALGEACRTEGIEQVSVPPLGCGLGGLRHEDVIEAVIEAARKTPDTHWMLHRWGARARAAVEAADRVLAR